MPGRAHCLVLMPFGMRLDVGGRSVDFDAVYHEVVVPGVAGAGLEAVRADAGWSGGEPDMVLDEVALYDAVVADLTTADAGVLYRLGARRAARPSATVQIHCGGAALPAVVGVHGAIAYTVGPQGRPERAEEVHTALAAALRHARETRPRERIPLYRFLEDYPHIQREKTDVFRQHVRYDPATRERLAQARSRGREEVAEVERSLGPLTRAEAGVLIDLLLSYRATGAWDRMIALAERMPAHLAATVLVQEQRAFALNRAGQSDEAERVLLGVVERAGPSSETLALLGRVYKDRWEAAAREGATTARDLLRQAIDAYRRGFEADWRDAYPGVNAVTLMELLDPPDPQREELLPVVRYAVARRIAAGGADYWDHATLLELAVLARDRAAATSALADARATLREPWEAETTARNLRLIREARERRGDPLPWADEVERTLQGAVPTAP